jgi:23S rRNA pseudouridine1911/1915/1917 synthase
MAILILKTNSIKLSSPATREFWEIPILFEDDHLLALDKPAQLMTSPNSDQTEAERPNLADLLHAGIAANKPWASERRLEYLGLLHRLDTEVSGVVVLAKSKTAQAVLSDFIGAQKPWQKYHALVRGMPNEEKFEVDAPLAPHPVKPGLMRVDQDHGKKSRTQFAVLERFPRHEYALLECEPFTLRPHQIRVHLREVDLPVVADELYGGKFLWLSRLKRDFRLKEGREERPLISRAALHAAEVSLPHPVTKELVIIKSDMPKDIKVGLKYLRQYSSGQVMDENAGFE